MFVWDFALFNMEPLEKIELGFGLAEIYPDFIIATMNEGVVITVDMNKDLLRLTEKYYPHQPFGYITNRKNSYAVDPRVYMETSKIKNLAGIAVVSENPINLSNVQVEQLFSKKPFRTFSNLQKAIDWIQSSLINT